MTTPIDHPLGAAMELTVEAYVTHPDGTTEGKPDDEPGKDGAA